MSGLAYPRNRIETCLIEAVLPLSYRIIPGNYLTSPLGTAPADSRFCTKLDGYTVLYASPDFGTAFIETVVRDRFTRRRRREVAIREVTERACALIATKSGIMLRLLDLRRDGCALIGAPTDTVNARNHAAGRAFGRVIHADYADIDGLIYASRLTGANIYAVFDRGLGKLEAPDSRMLSDHPELPDVLTRHRIGIFLDP